MVSKALERSRYILIGVSSFQQQKLDITVMTKCHTKKEQFFQTTQAITTLYNSLAWGASLLSRRVLRGFVAHTSNQIGRPGTKQQTFGKFNKKTKPQSN